MDNLNKLLDKKYELLTEVLSLCKNVKVSNEIEENIIYFSELYNDRQELFDQMKHIDEMIVEITGDIEKTKNDKINTVIQEIVEFDENYRKNEEEFKLYLNKKMKEINDSKKVNKKFNEINYEQVTGFSIQG